VCVVQEKKHAKKNRGLLVETVPDELRTFQHPGAVLDGQALAWVGASGVTGLEELRFEVTPSLAMDSVTLRFYFCEHEATAAGQRVFDVLTGGRPVLAGLDVFKEAGSERKILVKDVRHVDLRNLRIGLRPTADAKIRQSLLCGIEIIREEQPATPVKQPSREPNASPQTSPQRKPAVAPPLKPRSREEVERALGYRLGPHAPDAAEYQGHFYNAIDPGRHVTWQEAYEECKKMGGYLACIGDKREALFLCGLKENRQRAWIGVRYNEASRSWEWIDGTPCSYTDFSTASAWAKANGYDGVNSHAVLAWQNLRNCSPASRWRLFFCEWDY